MRFTDARRHDARREELGEDDPQTDIGEEVSDLSLVVPETVNQKNPEERHEETEAGVEEERRQEDRSQLGQRIRSGDVVEASRQIDGDAANVLVGLVELKAGS